MYDHPIKRAGLVFNRILLSNTRVALPAFPGDNVSKFKLSFKVKFFENGRETHRKYFNDQNLDELFPSRK